MVEELANKFENALTKGFNNLIILSILEKEPSHGYKIKKEIEERTLGMWIPADSTLYTDLKKMTKEQLIKFEVDSGGEKARKIYSLTEKGKKTLNIILKREKRIRNTIGSLISLLLGEDELKALFLDNSYLQSSFMPGDFFSANSSKSLSSEEKIEILLNEKTKFVQFRKFLKDTIENIDLALSKIK